VLAGIDTGAEASVGADMVVGGEEETGERLRRRCGMATAHMSTVQCFILRER
jgi:hypothetical protein